MHQEETKTNWIKVRVMGLGKTVRMDFEDVLVRAEEVYHTRQRTFRRQQRQPYSSKVIRYVQQA